MTDGQGLLRFWPNTLNNPFRTREEVSKSVPGTEPTLRDPVGLTASSTEREEDEYSDENIREWVEEDRLENQDPELVAWLKAQIGE